jgi:hypothetical protein
MPIHDDIDFDVKNEDWSVYELEDGTILKIKIVLMRIIQDTDASGNPIGGTLLNTIIASIPAKDLRGCKKIEPKFDLKYTVIKETWNEYDVKDGSILRIKPTLAQIDRTDKVDPRGEPLYAVNMQPFMKKVPIKV